MLFRSLYGKGRLSTDPSNLPLGYDEEKIILGRPQEKVTDRNTQESPFGKDRLGVGGMKTDYNANNKINPDFKGNSPLALEGSRQLHKYKHMLNTMFKPNDKKLIFEQDKAKESLLDESNIKDQDF